MSGGNGGERGSCGFAREGTACGRPASWIIVVGEDEQHLACEEHRNDVLLRFEPKDVSGIHPVGDGKRDA